MDVVRWAQTTVERTDGHVESASRWISPASAFGGSNPWYLTTQRGGWSDRYWLMEVPGTGEAHCQNL